jgi:N-acetylated-alpha-linked acidic dipeptidase
VLRLANADVLPIEFTTLADTLARYLEELTKLTETTRSESEERNRLVRERAYEIAADPTQTYVPPKLESPVPFLNFAPLQNAISRLQKSASEYDKAAGGATGVRLDQALMHIEHAFIRQEGLPRRPWFRHQIYAPGFYTGYGVKTLPGVREAIEQKQWSEANQQIDIVAKVIEGYAAEVDRAAEIARGMRPTS